MPASWFSLCVGCDWGAAGAGVASSSFLERRVRLAGGSVCSRVRRGEAESVFWERRPRLLVVVVVVVVMVILEEGVCAVVVTERAVVCCSRRAGVAAGGAVCCDAASGSGWLAAAALRWPPRVRLGRASAGVSRGGVAEAVPRRVLRSCEGSAVTTRARRVETIVLWR
jgi:hypothetical protein